MLQYKLALIFVLIPNHIFDRGFLSLQAYQQRNWGYPDERMQAGIEKSMGGEKTAIRD